MAEAVRSFEADKAQFLAMGGRVDAERRLELDARPKYDVDWQYLHMNRWAFDRIRATYAGWVPGHVDIGSSAWFVALLAGVIPVEHVDIRKPDFGVPDLTFKRGDLTNLPYEADSLKSLSCLHVAEHVGLGRYGDEVDPQGMAKACRELARVLAPGGRLFFAVPVGRPRVVFNSHRVTKPMRVVEMFPGLRLEEFRGLATGGEVGPAPMTAFDQEEYGCGLYEFTKRG